MNQKKKKKKRKKKEKKEKPKEIKQKYEFDYFKEIVNEPEIYLPLKHVYTLELTDNIKINEEKYQVYKKYQMNVHKETEAEFGKHDFDYSWGSSNLKDNIGIKLPQDLASKTKHPELYPKKYGCYNLIHRIDGKIAAVSIIDILPTALSSVYLYYNTDYKFLDMGVLTAILEIEYARSFHDLIDSNFQYYTLGFFNENIQKLRYKGFYDPTELLDRFTMNYVFLKDVKNLLKEGKHIQLSKEPNNPKYQYLTKKEIDDYISKLMIKFNSSRGEEIIDFCSFVFNCIKESYWESFFNDVKRFLELIPKDLIEQCSFYAKFR